MSNSNEIDDILEELRNKKKNKEGNTDKGISLTNDDDIVAEPDEAMSDIKNQPEIIPETEDNIEIIIPEADNTANEPFDSTASANFISTSDDEYQELDDDDIINNPNQKKKIIIIVVAIIAIVAIGVGTFFALSKGKKEEPTTTAAPSTTESTTAAPVIIMNPLTGTKDFNEAAVGKRPVGLVVENAQAARPQWGIDDSKYSPDIIVEGEVEGGETRMLWLYADYTALPEQIGPMRSARPPYIKFSELFDAIFIHWGQSSTSGNYYGADEVFVDDNVDHINQMTYSDKIGLFGRDYSRKVSSEHTGVLYGDKVAQAIEDAGFRTDAKESSYTKFSFSESAKTVGTTPCNSLGLKFSSNTHTRDWTYSTEDKMYHSTDYSTDVERTNLLVLYDTTEYIVKYNYGGSGRSETYCNYTRAGGKAQFASMGTITDITWSVEDGVIVLKAADGSDVELNPGKTWIGYASSNYSGSTTIA